MRYLRPCPECTCTVYVYERLLGRVGVEPQPRRLQPIGSAHSPQKSNLAYVVARCFPTLGDLREDPNQPGTPVVPCDFYTCERSVDYDVHLVQFTRGTHTERLQTI